MADKLPLSPVVQRAIAAFKRAHPSCPYGVEAFKVRKRQVIRVRGYETPNGVHGVVAEWSYKNNGFLSRVK